MTGEPDAGRARTAGALFLLLTLIYALGTGGHVYSPDALTMARTTESLVDRGEAAVPDPGYPPGFLTEGRDGRRYSKYGLAMPVAGIPGLLLGRAAGRVLGPELAAPLFAGPRFLWYDPADPREGWSFFGVSLTAAPLTAAAVVLLFLLATDAGLDRRQALVIAGVAGLASPLPVYAKTFFSEPLALLALTGAAWGIVRATATSARPRAGRWCVATGTFLGLAVAAKAAHLVLLPVAMAVIFWRRRAIAGRGPALRAALAVAAGAAPWGLVLAIGNAIRFGSPLETGYGGEAARFTTPFLDGLRGLLISPGRGLLIYLPLALVALLAGRRFARRTPAIAAWTAAAFAAFLPLYGTWHGWDGGWAWGPRFFVPLVPVLTLVASPWLLGEAGRLRCGLAWTAVVWGAGLNWLGTLVPFTEYHHALREAVGGSYLLLARWSWDVWPGNAYWRFPWDYWLLPRFFITPGAWPLAAAAGAAIALLPVLAWAAWSPEPHRRRGIAAAAAMLVGAVVAALIAGTGLGR